MGGGVNGEKEATREKGVNEVDDHSYEWASNGATNLGKDLCEVTIADPIKIPIQGPKPIILAEFIEPPGPK